MFRGKLKFLSGIILLVIVVIAIYVYCLYRQGGTEFYTPPVEKTEAPQKQIIKDMTVLSSAVEAYYAKNLKYPESLAELKPEFVGKIPLEAGTEKSFIYQSDETDRYRITVTDASRYGFKELFIENGKIIQK
jgi:hypothetical protein